MNVRCRMDEGHKGSMTVGMFSAAHSEIIVLLILIHRDHVKR